LALNTQSLNLPLHIMIQEVDLTCCIRIFVATLALGSRQRQRLARAWAKKEARECGRVWELTLTLPNELPFWELESWWTLESSESDYRGQNPSHWRIFYIIEKLLNRRCLKWDCMTHLDIWNISYGQKKGRESNWQFDSQPLKVKNRPDFLMFRWHATYRWKDLDKGYNFASDLILIRGFHTKLWGPKIAGVPTLAISGLPFGSFETKCHLDVGLVERHIVYYKGEDVGFSQVHAVVSLMSPSLPVARLNTKSALAMH
jgi:hypothetical protein